MSDTTDTLPAPTGEAMDAQPTASASESKKKTPAKRGRKKSTPAGGKKKAFVSAKPKPTKLEGGIEKAKRHRKRKYGNYNTYIYKTLKQIKPDLGISKRGMSSMNSFTLDMFDRLARVASDLSLKRGSCTMAERDIETSVKMILPHTLSQFALAEGKKAVLRYNKSIGKVEAAPKKASKGKGKSKAE
jgi:hypothetical protein